MFENDYSLDDKTQYFQIMSFSENENNNISSVGNGSNKIEDSIFGINDNNFDLKKENKKNLLGKKKQRVGNNNEEKMEYIDNFEQKTNFNLFDEKIRLNCGYGNTIEFNSADNYSQNIDDIDSKEEKKDSIEIDLRSDEEAKRFKFEITNPTEEKSPYGRKSNKDKEKGKKGLHTKISEDNKIRKIKSFFGKSLYKFIKSSFIKEEDLLKLEIDVNKCLRKEYNEELFHKKLKYLFMETNISNKYRLKNVITNEKLIAKIYKEQKEIPVIKILELTYLEAFDIFRRKLYRNSKIDLKLQQKIEGTNFLDNRKFNDAEIFFKKIIDDEKKKGESDESIKSYIEDINNLILNFEDWFNNKIGRNR